MKRLILILFLPMLLISCSSKDPSKITYHIKVIDGNVRTEQFAKCVVWDDEPLLYCYDTVDDFSDRRVSHVYNFIEYWVEKENNE